MEINNEEEPKEEEYRAFNSAMPNSEISEEDYFLTVPSEKLSNKNLVKFENLKEYPVFQTKNLLKKDDFEIICTMGRGSYAKVVKAKLIKDNTIFAIKIINKPFIIKVK